MSIFSAANIANAIKRVPSSSTKDLRSLLRRTSKEGLTELSEIIATELTVRGSIDLDKPSAERHANWSTLAADLDLSDAIHLAFREAPINDEELYLTRQIAQNPGIDYQALVESSRKGNVSLILGHMVFERLGFFRKFLIGTGPISDLLFQRNRSMGRVTYRLSVEAERSFRALGLI